MNKYTILCLCAGLLCLLKPSSAQGQDPMAMIMGLMNGGGGGNPLDAIMGANGNPLQSMSANNPFASILDAGGNGGGGNPFSFLGGGDSGRSLFDTFVPPTTTTTTTTTTTPSPIDQIARMFAGNGGGNGGFNFAGLLGRRHKRSRN